MNKPLLSFVLLCLLFQSCQEIVSLKNIQDVIVDKESMIFMNLDSTLLNGKHQFYYTDSIIAINGSFVEGELNGIVKFYHPSGILSEQGFWINGSREGKYLTFWEDGFISSNKNYQDDQLQGEALSYWQGGSLYMKSVYDNGVELSHTWYDIDSTLVEEVSLIDNLKRSIERYIIQDYIDDSDSELFLRTIIRYFVSQTKVNLRLRKCDLNLLI